MKTREKIIQDLFGIKPGAKDTTPMDYGECKKAMEAYATECCKATLDKAADKAHIRYNALRPHDPYQVHKESITSPENIILL